jgi:aconitate hydratase
MAFDIDMIKKVYAEMPAKVDAARKALGRPLTLSEKYCLPTCMPTSR